MRVYDGNGLKPIPLIAFLSYMSKGTRVHVKIIGCCTDFFAIIETQDDVVRTCKKAFAACGRHVHVLEVGGLDGFRNGVDIICK